MTEYNKLVRDLIPEIIVQNGEKAVTRIIQNDEEYRQALNAKLKEEADEVSADPSLRELADVMEVALSIGRLQGYTPQQIEDARAEKAQERGGFENRVFLISTEPVE